MRRLLAPLFLLLLLSACNGGDDDCGPGADTASITLGAITYDGFASSPNNDCTPVQGQEPTSITIAGEQSDPAGTGFLVLCLPRPDMIEAGQPIPLDDEELVQVIDLLGRDPADCGVSADDVSQATITFTGYCDDGLHEAGYAIALEGTVPVTVTCGDQDPVTDELDLAGTAAVVATQI